MKRVVIFISMILLIIVATAIYHFSFPIESDYTNLEANISQWLNRGKSGAEFNNIVIYDSVSLEKITYVPIELDDDIGYVLLNRSITGRYKISHSSHGNTDIRTGIIENDDKKYLLLMGRNTFGNIDKIKFTLDLNHEYEFDISKEKVFFEYIIVDSKVEIGPVSLDGITVFDGNGKDITESVISSGSSIE